MNDIIQILKSVGAIITDSHFVYASGKHGDVYMNKDSLYPHTDKISQVGKMFAEKHKDLDIDVVVGPSLGGIILSTWTAYYLSQIKEKKILGVFTEKDENKNQIFTRYYDKLVSGKNILVVDDITTTGGSIKKVINSVKEIGGNIIASCVMVNRDPENVTSESVGAPFSALGIIQASAYEEWECPFCKNNVLINTEVGHGKKYLDSRNN